MDIRRLSHFIALAEEGRFAAAAVRCNLSPAAFSRSIQSLESRLGLKLLDRDPQGATLTRTGEIVLRWAKELVFDSSCMLRDIELLKSGDAGELTIGVAPVPAAMILPELIVQLQRQSPQLIVKWRFGSLIELLPRLEAQEMDFCLGDPRFLPMKEDYAVARVGNFTAGLYCRKGHPLARARKLTAEAMRPHGLAALSITQAMLDSLLAGYGLAPGHGLPVTVECDDIARLMHLTAETDVLSVMPHAFVSAQPVKLHRLLPKAPSSVSADVHALWLRRRTLSPASRRAIDLAVRIAGRTGRNAA